MSNMFKLRYEGEGTKTVVGVGIFNPGDEKEVTEQVAANFKNQDDRNNGWVVTAPETAPPHSAPTSTRNPKTSKPVTDSKTKSAN